MTVEQPPESESPPWTPLPSVPRDLTKDRGQNKVVLGIAVGIGGVIAVVLTTILVWWALVYYQSQRLADDLLSSLDDTSSTSLDIKTGTWKSTSPVQYGDSGTGSLEVLVQRFDVDSGHDGGVDFDATFRWINPGGGICTQRTTKSSIEGWSDTLTFNLVFDNDCYHPGAGETWEATVDYLETMTVERTAKNYDDGYEVETTVELTRQGTS